MASNTITANTPTSWLVVDDSPVHIALAGTFDAVSIALEQRIRGTAYSVDDDTQTAIVYTAKFDDALNLNKGDRIRLNPTGGGGSLSVDWNIAGASIDRG